jgi:hypothetical protein
MAIRLGSAPSRVVVSSKIPDPSKVRSVARRKFAHDIVWIETGGNTIVYVNTTNSAEAQGSAQMEIVPTGVNLGLTASDFHHS